MNVFEEIVAYDDTSVSLKQAFIMQYVLSRAATVKQDMGGDLAAQEAAKAWEYIEKECEINE